jgi:predicted O-methyltransferase YrrM
MSTATHTTDERTRAYLQDFSKVREGDVLARLREETAALPEARMQISVEQGRLMAVLARSIKTVRAIEVGVFTGYSSICVARELPPGGRLTACDVSKEWTSIAQRYWQQAGVADRITLELGPASETLSRLIESGESNRYDFAFIDADKEAYGDYYEKCLELLRPGGVMTIDNMFMGGKVLDPQPDQPGVQVVLALTRKIFADSRVEPSLVPIGDGLLVATKLA